jgi:AcrR family transcriptional regulator
LFRARSGAIFFYGNFGTEPMRYSSNRKAETRERIVSEAAYRLRKDGIEGTGLVPLMKALGLTQGGFYAHFHSKDALVQASLEAAAKQMAARWQKLADDDLGAFLADYLSPRHRDNPGNGCILPSLAAELGLRGHPSAATDAVVTRFAPKLDRCALDPAAGDRGIVALAALVGALSLSRAVADPQLSERILEAVRVALEPAP